MKIELKRICVPTDFSDNAAHALIYGTTLAQTFKAELHLLHVVQDIDAFVTEPTGLAGWSSVEILEDMTKAAADQIAEDASKLPADLTVVKAVRNGVPFHEINRYADKQEIDLVIMGTHGRTGLKHFFVGSVAERVVRSCPCPVLTVRLPEHEFVVPNGDDKS